MKKKGLFSLLCAAACIMFSGSFSLAANAGAVSAFAAQTAAPLTGDTARMTPYVIVLILCAVLIILIIVNLIIRRRKKKS